MFAVSAIAVIENGKGECGEIRRSLAAICFILAMPVEYGLGVVKKPRQAVFAQQHRHPWHLRTGAPMQPVPPGGGLFIAPRQASADGSVALRTLGDKVPRLPHPPALHRQHNIRLPRGLYVRDPRHESPPAGSQDCRGQVTPSAGENLGHRYRRNYQPSPPPSRPQRGRYARYVAPVATGMQRPAIAIAIASLAGRISGGDRTQSR